MKNIHLSLIAAALLVLGAGISAEAFHDGGVGQCSGCHIEKGKGGAGMQLRAADPSSTCLICHAGAGSPNSYRIASSAGTAMSPGGDFYWLKKNFVWQGGSSPGDRHGHNIVAREFGFRRDARISVAPGGTYPSDGLGCHSCHDPHGKTGFRVSGSGSYGPPPSPGVALGNYRLLGGAGYASRQTAGNPFRYGAPVARQSSTMKFGESDSSHVDYGSGMSEWCRNCHEGIHIRDSAFKHPAGDRMSRETIDQYNRYVKTGDLSGNAATSYSALVPFERGTTEPAQLDPSGTQGPDANSRVMCLTCHRAHASAFRAIGRWDFDAQSIAGSHPASGDGGVTGSDVFFSYYGRDMAARFGASQKRFCERCHKP